MVVWIRDVICEFQMEKKKLIYSSASVGNVYIYIYYVRN